MKKWIARVWLVFWVGLFTLLVLTQVINTLSGMKPEDVLIGPVIFTVVLVFGLSLMWATQNVN